MMTGITQHNSPWFIIDDECVMFRYHSPKWKWIFWLPTQSGSSHACALLPIVLGTESCIHTVFTQVPAIRFSNTWALCQPTPCGYILPCLCDIKWCFHNLLAKLSLRLTSLCNSCSSCSLFMMPWSKCKQQWLAVFLWLSVIKWYCILECFSSYYVDTVRWWWQFTVTEIKIFYGTVSDCCCCGTVNEDHRATWHCALILVPWWKWHPVFSNVHRNTHTLIHTSCASNLCALSSSNLIHRWLDEWYFGETVSSHNALNPALSLNSNYIMFVFWLEKSVICCQSSRQGFYPALQRKSSTVYICLRTKVLFVCFESRMGWCVCTACSSL